MADPPLNERLISIAGTVAETVEDEEAATAVVEALTAAADAYESGDIETAHSQMHDALEVVAELAEAADGEAKQPLEAIGQDIAACMEETAGVLLGNHIQARLD